MWVTVGLGMSPEGDRGRLLPRLDTKTRCCLFCGSHSTLGRYNCGKINHWSTYLWGWDEHYRSSGGDGEISLLLFVVVVGELYLC